MKNMQKFKKLGELAPEAFRAFLAFDLGATEQELAEPALVAAALRTGGAVAHGTHTVA